ncbi:MAG: glycoside hydrolase family 88 protein [Planctomycetes bacterium]|jgi:hypothetical protein|nr:glycoside hydrolase family 88 protein [Planctomycetota bacterium]
MNRRDFLKDFALTAAVAPAHAAPDVSHAKPPEDWFVRWEKNVLGRARARPCDKEMGEELGWLVSPFLNGFYYAYRVTGDSKWVALLVDWADSWIQRGISEPDGFVGWPKSGTGGAPAEGFYTDSLLGEAMALRPVVLMAEEILKTAALQDQFGARARAYLALAEQVFEKWDTRGCWREVARGGLWVVPLFGIDRKTGQWTEGYARRRTDGFSNADNKQNHIARWLLALADVTKKPIYRERAEKWLRLMKSRLRTRAGGKYYVWYYWEPAGPWDYKMGSSPKHWVGVHPNGGYYEFDVMGMVAAFEHGLVFTRDDIQRLIATNRDFMWNQQVTGAKFQRLDGGPSDPRWKECPGVLWTPLVPHDETLRRIFLANHDPASWGALPVTPWFLAREAGQAVTL